MSGIVHNIMTKRDFQTTQGAGVNTYIPLNRAIDITDATSIDLLVRVHIFTLSGSIALKVLCESVSLTSEEPETDFAGSEGNLGILTLTSSPKLQQMRLSTSSGFGNMMRVRLKFEGAAASTLTTTLSIDIVVRDS